MTCTWLRRGNLKRETESLLTSSQNDVGIAKKGKPQERN